MSLRIALANATPAHLQETFVRHHVERLDHVVLLLNGGPPPETHGAGLSLLPSSNAGRLFLNVEGVITGRDRPAMLRARITRMLRSHRIDVVLAEYGITAAELLPCCRSAGVPLVVYFLGFDAFKRDVIERYGQYRELFAGAARIIAVSRSIQEQLIALGAPPEKIVYNSCGADTEHFARGAPEQAPPHFLAVGRFTDKKAPQLTLLSFARALRQNADIRLTMVGDGDLWEACHQLVRAHQLQHAVDLCGPRSPDQIATLLGRTRAFVQHSVITGNNDREGTPVAMLEAMGAGVPVISTRHGEIEELVKHGERGLLCEERDVDAMATHMLHLATDPELAGRMGRAGTAYVNAEHRLDDRIAALQTILEAAAGNTRR